jgi:hypothetical protein
MPQLKFAPSSVEKLITQNQTCYAVLCMVQATKFQGPLKDHFYAFRFDIATGLSLKQRYLFHMGFCEFGLEIYHMASVGL